MNATLHFMVPEHVQVASHKAHLTIEHLGAPLDSDSGHFATGVVPYGGKSVEVRISWLEAASGTQLTVVTSSEELQEVVLFRVAERVRNEFLNGVKPAKVPAHRSMHFSSLAVVVSAVLVLALFIMTLLHH